MTLNEERKLQSLVNGINSCVWNLKTLSSLFKEMRNTFRQRSQTRFSAPQWQIEFDDVRQKLIEISKNLNDTKSIPLYPIRENQLLNIKERANDIDVCVLDLEKMSSTLSRWRRRFKRIGLLAKVGGAKCIKKNNVELDDVLNQLTKISNDLKNIGA